MSVSKDPSRQVQKTLSIFIQYGTLDFISPVDIFIPHAAGVHMAKYHHTNKNINFTRNEMKSFKMVSLASYGIWHFS